MDIIGKPCGLSWMHSVVQLTGYPPFLPLFQCISFTLWCESVSQATWIRRGILAVIDTFKFVAWGNHSCLTILLALPALHEYPQHHRSQGEEREESWASGLYRNLHVCYELFKCYQWILIWWWTCTKLRLCSTLQLNLSIQKALWISHGLAFTANRQGPCFVQSHGPIVCLDAGFSGIHRWYNMERCGVLILRLHLVCDVSTRIDCFIEFTACATLKMDPISTSGWKCMKDE